MAVCDRHGRPQLVRRVVQEALLALEERSPLLSLELDGADRVLALPRMPHHRQEHRRHERHLEQLAPKL